MDDNVDGRPENVVFLKQHRHAKMRPHVQGSGEVHHLTHTQGGKKRGKGQGAVGEPITGTLYWLHCPVCNTLEYTEAGEPNPRVHGPCSTQVQMAPVDLDLRAEFSVASTNLERIDVLTSLLDVARQKQLEYLNRLSLAATQKIEPYADAGEKSPEELNVAGVDFLGLWQSRFFYEAKTHFARDDKK